MSSEAPKWVWKQFIPSSLPWYGTHCIRTHSSIWSVIKVDLDIHLWPLPPVIRLSIMRTAAVKLTLWQLGVALGRTDHCTRSTPLLKQQPYARFPNYLSLVIPKCSRNTCHTLDCNHTIMTYPEKPVMLWCVIHHLFSMIKLKYLIVSESPACCLSARISLPVPHHAHRLFIVIRI